MTTIRSILDIDNEASEHFWPESQELVLFRTAVMAENEKARDEWESQKAANAEIMAKHNAAMNVWRAEHRTEAIKWLTHIGKGIACSMKASANPMDRNATEYGYAFPSEFVDESQKIEPLKATIRGFFWKREFDFQREVHGINETQGQRDARLAKWKDGLAQLAAKINERAVEKFPKLDDVIDLLPAAMWKTERPAPVEMESKTAAILVSEDLFPDDRMNLCSRCPAARWEASYLRAEFRDRDGVMKRYGGGKQDLHLACECQTNLEKTWTLGCGLGVFICGKRPDQILAARKRIEEEKRKSDEKQ